MFFLGAALNPTQKRWRKAFAVVYSVGALSKDKFSIVPLHSPPYTVLDIHDHADADADGKLIDPLALKLSVVPSHRLTQLVKEKDNAGLHRLGGVEGVVDLLATDAADGVHGHEDQLLYRRAVFGSNAYTKPPARGFLSFAVDAMKDTMLIILLVCALVSLGFGVKEHGIKDGWYDGVSILVAIFLVVAVTAVSNFRQDRRFGKLSGESSNIKVNVVRDCHRQDVSVFDIVVGDVVFLKIGDQVPADGLFLDGHSLQLDESSMTGETAHIAVDLKKNPFLSSGTKVVDGYGHIVVTAVGMNTTWGEMMSRISNDNREATPLQERLEKLTTSIGKIGSLVAACVLAVLLIRYFTGSTKDEDGNPEFNKRTTPANSVVSALVGIVSDAVTIIVVAIPEGLPLAVTLTLAYSMKRMMADKAMVSKLPACETMGSVTTICTDKTGTLTLNQMKVVRFFVGQIEIVNDNISILLNRNNNNNLLLDLFHHGVGLNTTASAYQPPRPAAEVEITGSPTEKAILSWAIEDLGLSVDVIQEIKVSCDVLHVEAFNSRKKRSGVMVNFSTNNKRGGGHQLQTTSTMIHVYWKGAAEMVLAICSHYHEIDGSAKVMDADERLKLEQTIQDMAANSLRCIAFAYKEVKQEDIEVDEEGNISRLQDEGLTLLGMVGLKDPCRPEVRESVRACKDAGVVVRMITGDNVFTARAIAVESGILTAEEQYQDGLVIEGKTFREYSEDERTRMVDVIRVMARSSPFDKLLMVQCLKREGEVVAVTGDGTNDAPALKEADVGLSMGIQGTEVAKECSDVVILDDNFSSVVTVLRWGRCVYNNIQKFIQFQLTVNVAALTINFVAATYSGKVPLTTVQMLWVNLIMDTLGALALATERPSKELMEDPPVGRTAPLITNVMWRNLMSQALFQVGVLLVFEFKGESILGVDEKVKNTVLFNTFVFCQVFNEFNSRKLEKRNVFQGLHRNRLFVGIIAVTVVLQVVFVELLQKFAGTVRLNWGQWGICIGIAFLSWPIGWIIKFIPVSNQLPCFVFLKQH